MGRRRKEARQEQVPESERCTKKCVIPAIKSFWHCENRAAKGRKSCERHLEMARRSNAGFRMRKRQQAAEQLQVAMASSKVTGKRSRTSHRNRGNSAFAAAACAAASDCSTDDESEEEGTEEMPGIDMDEDMALPHPVVEKTTHLGLQLPRRPRAQCSPSNFASFSRFLAGSSVLRHMRGPAAATDAHPELVSFQCKNFLNQTVCLQARAVLDSVPDGEGVRLALITCFTCADGHEEVVWADTVRASPIAVCGNADRLWAVAGDRGRLLVYNRGGVMVQWPLVLDSNVAFMDSQKGTCKLLCVTANGGVHLWDFQDGTGGVSLLRDWLHTGLYPCHYGTRGIGVRYQDIPESLRVVKASLSEAGMPVIQLVNGSSFTYEETESRWLQVSGHY